MAQELVQTKVAIVVFGNVLFPDILEAVAKQISSEISQRAKLSWYQSRIREQEVRQLFYELWMNSFGIRVDNGPTAPDLEEQERTFWGEAGDRLRRRLRVEIDPERWRERTNEFVLPVPGMAELLRELHAREVVLALCENNTPFWATRERTALGLDELIPRHRCIYSFDAGADTADVRRIVYRMLVEATSVDASLHLLFDRAYHSLVCAREAGMQGYLIHPSTPIGEWAKQIRAHCMSRGIL